MEIRDYIRDIPDFPKEGIVFKDITPLLQNSAAFKKTIDELEKILKNYDFSAIVAPESRGFIFGPVLTYKMDKKFIPIRKPGKLPYTTNSVSYELEYGESTLEMHTDALEKDEKVVIVDDILATGGTTSAIIDLIEKTGGKANAFVCIAELSFLNPRDKLKNINVESLIRY